jgi:hypothetical protein
MPEVGVEFDRVVPHMGHRFMRGDRVRLINDLSDEHRWRICPMVDGDHEVLEYVPISSLQRLYRARLRRLR